LSGSAVAARTATNKRADIFNNFARVPHRSIFETIKLRDAEAPLPIQKLMSAPVLGSNGEVVGVVQISRKGETPGAAGRDFMRGDLDKLVEVAVILSPYVTKLHTPEPASEVAVKTDRNNVVTMPSAVA